MEQHKKTVIGIVVGFAALMFVFAYFPAAPNSQQMPGQNGFPPQQQPDMGGNSGFVPGSFSPNTHKELLPEGRLSDLLDQPSQPIQAGPATGGGSQDLSKMMNDVYGSTRSDLPVVQGRNPSAPPPMGGMPPMGSMGSMGSMPSMPPQGGGGWPFQMSGSMSSSSTSMPMQQYPGFSGMQQQSFGFQQAPATGGFSLPSAPKKDLWSSIFGSGDANNSPEKKAEETSRQESSYSATEYELSVARSKASQAQSYLDQVRSASTTSEKQSAASEARYYAAEARAAADRASYKAQGNPRAQGLVSSARAEANRASSAASYASSEASY